MKRAIPVLMLLATLGSLTACSALESGAREVKIDATEMTFTPNVIQVKPGERIKFVIENKGTVMHEFVSEELKFEEVEVLPGESGSVVVKMPTKAGTYPFYCEARGHHEAGMQGTIEVSN